MQVIEVEGIETKNFLKFAVTELAKGSKSCRTVA
jgi:hypothetical protein